MQIAVRFALNEVEVDPNYFCLVEALFLCSDLVNVQVPAAATCDHSVLGFCLVATDGGKGGIFGFAEFVQAFALLVLIYTLTGARYQFRIYTAPIPLWPIVFGGTAFIGLATLLSDVIFAKAIPLPAFLADQTLWQLCLGLLFLGLILVWLWYAYIRPSTFGSWNALSYTRAVYRYVLQGDQNDLPAIAAEIEFSARNIVKHAIRLSPVPPADKSQGRREQPPAAAQLAHDLLLILGNRRFCRTVVACAPNTAIALFEAMSEFKNFGLPAGQLASNISTEALLNKDSLLYHEDAGYFSGYLGYVKPFTNALYGDFNLVEGLAGHNNSPLDVDLDARWNLDSKQLSAYSRAVLVTFESAIANNQFDRNSYALRRAFRILETACRDLYKLDEELPREEVDEILGSLRAVTEFIEGAIAILHRSGVKQTRLRRHDDAYKWDDDYYDKLASLMFEIIGRAAYVRRSNHLGWTVQYSMVWSGFANYDNSKTRKIILFKLRRLLYEEIKQRPNFNSARYLGFCLNVFGLKTDQRIGRSRGAHPLREAVIAWARKNYLGLVEDYPDIADAVLMGTISFDATTKRLVKTYAKGLNNVAPTDALELEERPAKSAETAEKLAV